MAHGNFSENFSTVISCDYSPFLGLSQAPIRQEDTSLHPGALSAEWTYEGIQTGKPMSHRGCVFKYFHFQSRCVLLKSPQNVSCKSTFSLLFSPAKSRWWGVSLCMKWVSKEMLSKPVQDGAFCVAPTGKTEGEKWFRDLLHFTECSNCKM